MRTIVSVLLVLCQSYAMAKTAVEEVTRSGQEHLYRAEFDTAEQVFRKAAVSHPEHPAPFLLLSATALWRGLYFGIRTDTDDAIKRYAYDARAKAERLSDPAERHFWRGSSAAFILLAEELSLLETGELTISVLLRAPRLAGLVRNAESDLKATLALDPKRTDATLLLTLLNACRNGASPQCVDELWKPLNDPVWFPIEFKYLFLDLLYRAGDQDRLGRYGVPTAIELSLRYPTNGIFHIALLKINYESNNLEDAHRQAMDIVKNSKQYGGTFGIEAEYFLGVISQDKGDCKTALKHFSRVIETKARDPGYLMPWSLLRSAQCRLTQKNRVAAAELAQAVLTYPNVSGVHESAKQFLVSLRQGR